MIVSRSGLRMPGFSRYIFRMVPLCRILPLRWRNSCTQSVSAQESAVRILLGGAPWGLLPRGTWYNAVSGDLC